MALRPQDRLKDETISAVGGVAVDVSGGNQTLKFNSRAFYVGVTGNLVVTMSDGSGNLTFTNIPVGWHPISATTIIQTGTTVTSTLALW